MACTCCNESLVIASNVFVSISMYWHQKDGYFGDSISRLWAKIHRIVSWWTMLYHGTQVRKTSALKGRGPDRLDWHHNCHSFLFWRIEIGTNTLDAITSASLQLLHVKSSKKNRTCVWLTGTPREQKPKRTGEWSKCRCGLVLASCGQLLDLIKNFWLSNRGSRHVILGHQAALYDKQTKTRMDKFDFHNPKDAQHPLPHAIFISITKNRKALNLELQMKAIV